MTARQAIRRAVTWGPLSLRCALSRALGRTRFAPRFSGAYADRAMAVAAQGSAPDYNDDAVADVSFEVMCQRAPWDYPVIFWLSRLLQNASGVLDAGGHMGTKYIAFGPLLDMQNIDWTVYDLPATVRVAKARQAAGSVPKELRFVDALSKAPAAEILLCSGLLQYLDIEFSDFVGRLPKAPRFIILNKVALTDGPGRFALERIGAARVPYQIRNRAAFEDEVIAMGYQVIDTWTIPDLSHVIPTHPWLGASQSCGFVLKRENR